MSLLLDLAPLCVLLVVQYGRVPKRTQNNSGNIPNRENTPERITKSPFKSRMDKRSGFWQVGLTRAVRELLALVNPQGRDFRWKVITFGVVNAPVLLQGLMSKILFLLIRRPLVQELVSCGAETEPHIVDVSLYTNIQDDDVLLLEELFIVCQENRLHIKLEKGEFMREEMDYQGFNVGYGCWKSVTSRMQSLQDMQLRDDPEKGLQEVRSFIGACILFWHHIRNYIYCSAPPKLTL